MPSVAYLGLGSNLGDRAEHLRAAVSALDSTPGVRVSAVSPVYESKAHTRAPTDRQPDFLNAVVRASVNLNPEALLAVCRDIESDQGRSGGKGTWQPRSLDIDILLFGDRTVGRPGLVVPHERLAERLFVLTPLADLIGMDTLIPVVGQSVRTLIAACSDPDQPVRTLVDLFPAPFNKSRPG